MFLVSLKSLKGKLILLVLVVIAAIVLCVVFSPSGEGETDKESLAADAVINYSASNDEERMNFIKQLGLTVNPEPESVTQIIIPDEFDEVYSEYNELQKKSGLDLSDYRGCKAKKWTYAVTNYPGYEDCESIRINLIVYKGKVIGGDICNIELDGFMTGLE